MGVTRSALWATAILAFCAVDPVRGDGVTVSVCYSEIPYSSCSFTEIPFHQSTLQGPVPSAEVHTPEPYQPGDDYHRFVGIAPGNYIVRTTGRCNPFGCFLDTAVTVGDSDVYVQVEQIGGQTPNPTPHGSPRLPATTAA